MNNYLKTISTGLMVFAIFLSSQGINKNSKSRQPEFRQTAIYVSTGGNDLADGKTLETALKTIRILTSNRIVKIKT